LGGVGSAGELPFVCAASGEARNSVVIAIAIALLQVIGRLLVVEYDPSGLQPTCPGSTAAIPTHERRFEPAE
jgi:hypothetical protein